MGRHGTPRFAECYGNAMMGHGHVTVVHRMPYPWYGNVMARHEKPKKRVWL